jgi:serine/threonine protein kinase
VAERQFGPYKLIRQIAVGGMAEIHLAKTAGIAGFEKYVALKMIHPNFAEDDQFIQMLVDEAKIAVQLTHGNIAQTFDLGRVGETYYITMEYVDGADLYKILRRASEQDVEMPLDVCAFIGKEISSALDHAHRKRDHTGKSLGIVHRDVSPQNVLVSYAGEVKLVDFGIAKATMKARQTAVGVIKGKYYYMSPEQAWGDPIDYRSDIFSAGIVLYEMITGQMLYLEEDLHKLLEMARNAEIAPPSKIRRGVPPQLERIVMRSLAKIPGERYQSAGDFATDLERFLHAYSPVFTTSKLASLLRQVVGDPMQVPDEAPFESIEFRDGVMSTHPLDDSEVAHAVDRDELRDENSMIFRVAELEQPRPTESMPVEPRRATPRPATPRPGAPPSRPGTPPPRPGTLPPMPAQAPSSTSRPTTPSKPLNKVVPRVTRPADAMPELPRAPAGPAGPSARPSAQAKIPQITKPRQLHEETRQLESPAPTDPLHDESSGLLLPDGKKLPAEDRDGGGMFDDDLENIGERTLVTAAPGMSGASGTSGISGFMMDFAGNDDDGPVEATLVTAMPSGPGFTSGEDSTAEAKDEDVPTVARDFEFDPATRPARPKIKAPPPPAFAAKIHAPAISELRKPRASRRTPPGGVPIQQQNVLAAIMSSQASEPMPAPRPAPPPPLAMPMPTATPLPEQAVIPHAPHPPTDPFAPQFPTGTPGGQAPYSHDASGLPMGIPTPPGMSVSQVPGVPAHLQPYLHMQGVPPGYAQPQGAAQMSSQGYPQVSPGAVYQFQPTSQPMSLTGQMRLYEVDELPSQYQLVAARRRWFTYLVSGVLAVSVAAAVTFLIIRSMRDGAPVTGSVHIESVPAGADVLFDGTRLTDKTPLTIDGAPVGTRHSIRLELARHEPADETIDIPRTGGLVAVTKTLTLITGTLTVVSDPPNAEIWINRELRGRTPATLKGVDVDNVRQIELRLKDYQPLVKDLSQWPSDGKLGIQAKLVHVH